jgi:phenylalanine-4-hydroxylase
MIPARTISGLARTIGRFVPTTRAHSTAAVTASSSAIQSSSEKYALQFEQEGLSMLGRSLRDSDVNWLRDGVLHVEGADNDDVVYMKRRDHIKDVMSKHRFGQAIPSLHTDDEHAFFKSVHSHLRPMMRKYACDEHLINTSLIENAVGHFDEGVPELNKISDYINDRTGFRILPVVNLIKPRCFFALMSLRVFPVAIFLRHPGSPFLSPEPDILHDLLGHVPMLAHSKFADMTQKLGEAGLNAKTEKEMHLASMIYWNLAEFGVCRANPDADVKVYGAAILSSVGEMGHLYSDKSSLIPLDIDEVVNAPYEPETYDFQPNYTYTANIDEALSLATTALPTSKSRKRKAPVLPLPDIKISPGMVQNNPRQINQTA